MDGSRVRRVLVLAAVPAAAAGCVERRFVVESNVPGAQVYINNVPVGPSPADARWDYPGCYEFRIVAQGYEPLFTTRIIRPKWYEYPGLDFFFDALYPFHIEDVRRLQFTLVPATQVRTDELLDAANRLRDKARTLPPPEEPQSPPGGEPRRSPAPPPAVIPIPPDLPPGEPPPASGAIPPTTGIRPPSLPARPQ
jgi:hypothetical protein